MSLYMQSRPPCTGHQIHQSLPSRPNEFVVETRKNSRSGEGSFMNLNRHVLSGMKVGKLFKDNEGPINSCDFFHDGKHLVSTSDDDSIRLYDCVDDNLEVLRKGGKCRCRVGFEVGFRTVFSSQSRICEAHWCVLRAIHARARPRGARFDEANGAVDSIGGIFVFKIIARCRRLQIACTSWTYTATNMFVYHLLRRRCGCNLHAWRHQ